MEKNKIKGISKVIYIIAKISMVLVGMGGTIIALLMFAAPILVNNTTISDSKINFFENEYSYSIEVGKITIDDNELDYYPEDKVDQFISAFDEDNKLGTIVLIEFVLALSISTIALMFLALQNLYKLFKNIHDEETPFNEVNIKYITVMAKYLLISMIISTVGGMIVNGIVGLDIGMNIDFVQVLTILIIYALSLIFEHGYNLQKEIDTTL